MTVEDEMKILEEINKEIITKGRLLYSYEIKEILDRFIVKGEWIEKQETPTSISYYCSNCEHIGLGFEDFCAWCGADMRGDKNELQHN